MLSVNLQEINIISQPIWCINTCFFSISRGIYLACLFYHGEKVLVTDEDKCLPMVEVDDTYSSTNLCTDYSWLLKVCCHWDDVRQLKYEMDRLTSVTSYSLRHQLLVAATQLQVIDECSTCNVVWICQSNNIDMPNIKSFMNM